MMDLLDKLQLENLDGDQLRLAEAIGIEAFKKLVTMYAGTTIYIPTLEKLTIGVRDKMIRDEYNGYNHKALALKYGISEQWVRVIVGSDIKPIDGQIAMF